jgi:hypothetical protein
MDSICSYHSSRTGIATISTRSAAQAGTIRVHRRVVGSLAGSRVANGDVRQTFSTGWTRGVAVVTSIKIRILVSFRGN